MTKKISPSLYAEFHFRIGYRNLIGPIPIDQPIKISWVTILSPWVGRDSFWSHPLEYYFSLLFTDIFKDRDHRTSIVLGPSRLDVAA